MELLLSLEESQQFLFKGVLADAYPWLMQSLNDFFAGTGAKIADLSAIQLELYGVFRNYYLKWYGLLYEAWDYSCTHCRESGETFLDGIPEPNDALLAVLKSDEYLISNLGQVDTQKLILQRRFLEICREANDRRIKSALKNFDNAKIALNRLLLKLAKDSKKLTHHG
jgi:hypothetical protein